MPEDTRYPKPKCRACGVVDYEHAKRDKDGVWVYYCTHCRRGEPT